MSADALSTIFHDATRKIKSGGRATTTCRVGISINARYAIETKTQLHAQKTVVKKKKKKR